MGHTPMPISTDIVSQIAHKMPDLWYPLDTSTANEVMYRTQRQPLLVKCFKTFHGCTSQVGGASESMIYLHFAYWSYHAISTDIDSLTALKMHDFGYHPNKASAMLFLQGVQCIAHTRLFQNLS